MVPAIPGNDVVRTHRRDVGQRRRCTVALDGTPAIPFRAQQSVEAHARATIRLRTCAQRITHTLLYRTRRGGGGGGQQVGVRDAYPQHNDEPIYIEIPAFDTPCGYGKIGSCPGNNNIIPYNYCTDNILLLCVGGSVLCATFFTIHDPGIDAFR